MKKLLLLILVATAGGTDLRAQTNTTAPAWRANRYLFIVETSRPMQRRAEGVIQAVQKLMDSAMDGQLHAGDSLGVWTFNSDLQAGKFPLQRWTPQTQKDVTSRVLNFLQGQTYTGGARLERIMPAMDEVMSHSPFITIVLLTTGDEKIQGTSYDATINESFTHWREQQQQAKMPFVTLLRARGGQFTDCTVTPFPWQIDLPALPAELTVPLVAKKTAASAVKSAHATVPPLIVSGKKPAPAPLPALQQSNDVVASVAPLAGATDSKVEPAASASSSRETATTAPHSEAGAPAPVAAHAAEKSGETSAVQSPALQLAASRETSASPSSKPGPTPPLESAESLPSTSPPAAIAAPRITAEAHSVMSGTFSHLGVLWFVVPGLCLAGTLLWFLRARSRGSEKQISLITRSLSSTKH